MRELVMKLTGPGPSTPAEKEEGTLQVRLDPWRFVNRARLERVGDDSQRVLWETRVKMGKSPDKGSGRAGVCTRTARVGFYFQGRIRRSSMRRGKKALCDDLQCRVRYYMGAVPAGRYGYTF